jgi:hypothetical protein
VTPVVVVVRSGSLSVVVRGVRLAGAAGAAQARTTW